MLRRLPTAVVKRSVVVMGHKTSVSLEDAFWTAVRELARRDGATVSQFVGRIDRDRDRGNLSSALRLAVLQDLCAQLADARANTATVAGALADAEAA